MVSKMFGYVPDPAFTERYVRSLPYPNLGRDVPKLMAAREKREVHLWDPLRKVKPSWERGAQGTGDCVSWGAEICSTLLLAQLACDGQGAFEAEAATEAIYGGCRVEVNNGRCPLGRSPGASGSWAAKWLRDWGVLLRLDYSKITGNPEHDLTVYDVQRADNWGVTGCGGRNDKQALDDIARKHPIKEVSQVTSVEAAEAALLAGCPISIASGVGFEGRRNADGIIRRNGEWPHQMAVIGLRYTPMGEPLFRVVNSWGKSVAGPDPGVDWQAISDCSWWIIADDLRMIIRDDDTFTFSKVAGFDLPPFKWEDYVWV